ncbi:acetyltransferase [Paenibacillus sp. FSL R7-0273]|uniref:GNAT family N-acetyltransferase n=1 Tax=Paenibacillus sp. FSL R7-0273 TaxID=1536772 RepID=UPI0004F7F75D|nr:GNAT family N-acetyltransferase [Paenibacillus sp. FSL R7-0273]AIQ47158.1 acetyltransferase [Paenibacillus sp. FSL R7-0273]OMF97086.1 GNAT family N-acetyltransferase [Paenibacillus sp. FSL R7-0273]
MRAATETIDTVRLKLRPFKMEDAPSMHANWINDIDVQSNYGEPVYSSIALVEELLHQWVLSYNRNDFYRWAIILKEHEECIGQIAFCQVDTDHRLAEIEYCIGRPYQNTGYATEALIAVIQYTFSHTPLHRLQAYHRGQNEVSGKVMQKAHMQFEGTHKESYYYSDTGEYDDKHYYGIVKGTI